MSERLQNFPISFFAVVMGLAGAAIAWQRTESLWDWNSFAGASLLWLSGLTYLLIFIIYLTKSFLHVSEVKKEFKNIAKLAFFPTITISLLLLSIAAIKNKKICIED